MNVDEIQNIAINARHKIIALIKEEIKGCENQIKAFDTPMEIEYDGGHTLYITKLRIENLGAENEDLMITSYSDVYPEDVADDSAELYSFNGLYEIAMHL